MIPLPVLLGAGGGTLALTLEAFEATDGGTYVFLLLNIGGGGGGAELKNEPPGGGGGGAELADTPPGGGGGGAELADTPPGGGGGGGSKDPNPRFPELMGGGGGGGFIAAKPSFLAVGFVFYICAVQKVAVFRWELAEEDAMVSAKEW